MDECTHDWTQLGSTLQKNDNYLGTFEIKYVLFLYILSYSNIKHFFYFYNF